MQKINYIEKIKLENTVDELLMINIDKDLQQTIDNNCIKISGALKISGQVKSKDELLPFSKDVNVDIILDKEQLVDEKVDVDLEDFDYSIENDTISINLIIKIDGLKEIEPFFPTQEDQEDIEIVEEEREENNIIELEEEEETEVLPIIEEKTPKEMPNKEENNTEKSYSLLSQIFKNKSIKKETTYKLHVVKTQTNYEEIALLYNVNVEYLKSANNDEEIYIGKLIFIPNK